MSTTILITGSTDGIGLHTAHKMVAKGHHVLVHGRNPAKLETTLQALSAIPNGGPVHGYVCDLSRLPDVRTFAAKVAQEHPDLQVLVNNAGVYSTPQPITDSGLDVRFVVNTLAPYLLAQLLLPVLGPKGRVINLSSAAQAPVNVQALMGRARLEDGPAYAQSKLALTSWSRTMALSVSQNGPVVVAVNPGSMLASNMVKDAFGVPGRSIDIGADILVRAALSSDFAQASGRYFDNDPGQFRSPHPHALDPQKGQQIVQAMEEILAKTQA